MNTSNVNQAVSQQIFQILSKSQNETLAQNETLVQNETLSSTENLVSLEGLSAGDILKGRVQSLDNGLLLIKLLDGSSFTASAPEGFTANLGDPITLMIGEKQNHQITAKIINNTQVNNKTNDNIRSNLESLGVFNPDNMVSKVLDFLKAEPGTPLDKAAFFVANNLSADSELGGIIQKISEHEFSLHENLNSLKNGIMDSLSKMNTNQSSSLLKPLLLSQTMEELTVNLKNDFQNVPIRIMESISQKVSELLTKTLMEEISGQECANVAASITKEDFEAIINSSQSEINSNTEELKGLLNPQETERLLKAVNKALEDFHIKADELQKGEKEDTSKEIRDIIERLFDKASIKADNGSIEDLDVKEKSKALKEIMEFAQKALKSMDNNARESSLPAFKEVNNAFKFFNQVTSYDSIFQLPLKINREDTTGELYIMKRKNGRKKMDTENFTLFLSLKTSSLGLVESFLNATKKRITISFRVEDEGLVKLVKDNYKVLYDGLLEKGFTLVEMKCRLLENERINPFNADTKAKELLGIETRVDLRI